MRFCSQCQSIMTKVTDPNKIYFKCRCMLVEDGAPDDTLMYEEFLEASGSNQKHEVFIENSPFDLAGNVILMDCPQCGLNFMIMIRVGINDSTIYTCSCGYRTDKK